MHWYDSEGCCCTYYVINNKTKTFFEQIICHEFSFISQNFLLFSLSVQVKENKILKDVIVLAFQ